LLNAESLFEAKPSSSEAYPVLDALRASVVKSSVLPFVDSPNPLG
jgi:hypothetical protein